MVVKNSYELNYILSAPSSDGRIIALCSGGRLVILHDGKATKEHVLSFRNYAIMSSW